MQNSSMLCLGIFLILLGIDGFFGGIIVTFNRLQNTCVRISRHFWQKAAKQEVLCALSDIKLAKINEQKVHPGAATCSIVLILKNGNSIALFNHSSAFIKCKKDEETINRFLESDKNELRIFGYSRWIYLGCLLVGLFFILKASNLFEFISS